TQRAIHSPLIVFVFRHEFLLHPRNRVCLKEILKDVRSRSRTAGVQPALLGLVHSTSESRDSWQSVRLLEQLLKTVFKGHPDEATWVGHFIPKKRECILEIKKNACKAIRASLCAETGHFMAYQGRQGLIQQRPHTRFPGTRVNFYKGTQTGIYVFIKRAPIYGMDSGEFALPKLDTVVSDFWAEISESVDKIEVLYEDETFRSREFATLVASKVFYHLGAFEEALNYALGAGDLFNVSDDS
ncbi:PSMD1 ATPase, partial [Polyodon spathula]|nr:PSMD1 ATPase [Polyodon spathula]